MKGEATDGHLFVDQAVRRRRGRGAGQRGRPPIPHVRVADTTQALERPRPALRGRATPARSSASPARSARPGPRRRLFAALDRSAPGRAHRSVKSYNNHTGVPLSLARMPRAARFGVFEMGMNHAGELAALTRLVRPHVAIVTAIAPAHREFFASDAAIADAKGEIFAGAGARRHRDHPVRQPASRPADRRRPAACGAHPHLRPRRGRRRPRHLCRARPARRLDGDRAASRRAAELHHRPARARIG